MVAMSPVVYQPSLQHFGGLLRAAKIALHHVRTFHQQHARIPGVSGSLRVRIDDLHADSGQRMADFSAARADLAESRRAEVAAVDRDDGRALGAAVAFQRTNAKSIFEGQGHAVGSFSAPTSTYCRLPKLSGEQRRM